MSHFLLIEEGSYDASTVFGIYDTLDAAREDAERRTAAKAKVEAQARANRKPGHMGDPGPYVESSEYGINFAQIQEWDGPRRGKTWEQFAPGNVATQHTTLSGVQVVDDSSVPRGVALVVDEKGTVVGMVGDPISFPDFGTPD